MALSGMLVTAGPDPKAHTGLQTDPQCQKVHAVQYAKAQTGPGWSGVSPPITSLKQDKGGVGKDYPEGAERAMASPAALVLAQKRQENGEAQA